MDSHVRAEKMVRNFSLGALSSLLVPSLLAEWVVLPAIQLTLIHQLCQVYGQKFVVNAVRAKIAVFLAWLGLHSVNKPLGVILRHVPLIGAGWPRIGTALIGSASTYAIGNSVYPAF